MSYISRLQSLIFYLGVAFAVGLFYLVVSRWGFGFSGFPLDDAWIHQTYARNLARSGQLAFTPGVPSAGSTAPLWSFLLSVGYWLGMPFQIYTYSLGLIFLGLTGWTVARLGRHLFPHRQRIGFWAGLFCVFEWHLVWAAVSGMETILFVWLSTFLVERYLSLISVKTETESKSIASNFQLFSLGLLGGLLVLTRPEGLGLLGLIGLAVAYRWRQAQAKIGDLLLAWISLAVGAGVLLLPYLAFHLWMTGLPLPNTFYAKQAEYGLILQTYPLWWRLFGNVGPVVESVQGVFRVIFIGPQILLLPGLCLAAWLTVKERRTELIVIWLWWLGYLMLYAFRLPVTYQHGRYQMPAIPWLVLLGVWGTFHLVNLWASLSLGKGGRFILRLMGRVLTLSLIVLVLAFIPVGARAYGRDVHFIESEMVAAAKWLNEHTAPDALIVAHDIGAIGYFTQRPLIDLAGLITPEIIPIIRDETALLDFIIAGQADYLVTFPAWYPDLTQNPFLVLIYPTRAPGTRQAGGDNMAVYQLIKNRP
ncbi:MAG: hypothetical protein JW953_20000 [Anaerolineae bacterium]|nr:hypothetical protein [Anaerolineae bacterium]